MNDRLQTYRRKRDFRVARDGGGAGSTGSPEAGRAPLPAALAPQLATLVKDAPPGDDWHYEAKLDGYRILARIDGDDIRLFTRNGLDWTARLEPLVPELLALGLRSGWLDGEIVVANERGVPEFQLLQNAFERGDSTRIRYIVFDLPYCNGEDLRAAPLTARRARLRALLRAAPASELLSFSEELDAAPATLLRNACRMGLEGLIAKRGDARYESRRSASWVKLKCGRRQEFVIGGYTEPQGSRHGFGSLLLGVHDEAGRLRYAGRVGSGFSAATLETLGRQLKALASKQPPFVDPPRGAGLHWVKPQRVAEVAFAEWTRDGVVRQAVYQGMRDDKPPRTIVREQPASIGRKAASEPAAGRTAPRSSATVAGVRITHPDRLIDPANGITKLDLALYYESVAEALVAQLRDRPVALVRAPDGLNGERFVQKHPLPSPALSRSTGDPPMLAIGSVRAIMEAVQMNTIEFHTSNARRADRPDRIVFDLDPGEGVDWPQVQEAARLTQALLSGLSLNSFLKTSGGSGLHVVVPIAPTRDWDSVKAFSKAVVDELARTLPQRFVAKSGPRNRVGRIFVDYLRNGRGATTVAAFSARARPGLPVSMPVDWSELDELTSSVHWSIADASRRLDAVRRAWAGYARSRQSLTRAFGKLGVAPGSGGG
ncbi:MAG: DNA ligase D [Burkholderiaceae bacterium]